MNKSHTWRDIVFSDAGVLILLALAVFVLHVLTNGQYGFHRDELATLDDARYLDWGYVVYPPLTPFLARIALELFGPSLAGVRLFAALSPSIVLVLAGLMARDLGGSRLAQIVSALAAAIAPVAFMAGYMLMYVSFDYVWWVLLAWFAIRLLKSEDPRWWLGIGAAIGLGMMTKYTMGFFVVGIVGGTLLTRARRYLTSPWLWAGAGLSLLIFLPNLIWQIQHDFITLDFLGSIHARDVDEGRADGFLLEQLLINANIVTSPLWLAGLYFYFFRPEGRPYRAIGWMYVITLAIFWILQGRGYYVAPAYPMLIAAGAVVWDGWRAPVAGAGVSRKSRAVMAATWVALGAGGLLAGAITLPIAPINSGLWRTADQLYEVYSEQLGWPELVATVAGIYDELPAEEKARTGILAGNYGEAGAVNLYGPAYGLPEAISGINSYWLRGYGDPPPQTLIVLGYQERDVAPVFETCELVAPVTNRYNVENEETSDYPGIFVCRGLRRPWFDLWKDMLHFG